MTDSKNRFAIVTDIDSKDWDINGKLFVRAIRKNLHKDVYLAARISGSTKDAERIKHEFLVENNGFYPGLTSRKHISVTLRTSFDTQCKFLRELLDL